jgi:hypothetical protein
MNKLIILGIFLLASCTKSTEQQELTASRNKWERKSISNYEFTLMTGCFCPQEVVGPHNIKVVNDKIQSVDNQPYDTLASVRLMTIDELFSFVSKSLAMNPYKYSVKYDSAYGFPENVYFDFYKTAVDEEIGYTVTDFRVD